MKVKLGDLAKDIVTGLEGIVISRTEWLNGCIRIQLQPRELKDGKPVDMSSFDEEQTEVLEAGAVVLPVEQEAPVSTGGPYPEPTRAKTPSR